MQKRVTPVFLKRLTIGVLLINFFILALAGISIRQSLLQQEEQATITAQNLSQVLDEYINGVITKIDASLLAVVDETEHQLAVGRIDSRTLNAYIVKQRLRIPEIDGLRMTDAWGDVVYGTDVPLTPRVNISDRDYFIHSRDDSNGSLSISKPVVGRISKKLTINIAHRFNKPDGSFGGVVFAAITLKSFAETFSRINVGNRGTITLFDSDLGVICRYPEPKGGSIIGRKLISPEIRELFQKSLTSGTYRTGSTMDGIERTFSYRKIASYPLYIQVGLAREDYLAEWRNETAKMSVLVVLFSIAVLCLAWLLYRYITSRRQAEVRAIESEKKLKNITSSLAEGICVMNRDGNIIFMNAEAERLLGWTAEELKDKNAHDLIHCCKSNGKPLSFENCPIFNVLRTGKSYFSDEEIYNRKDGTVFPASVLCSPISDNPEETTVVVAFRDITVRKKIEEDLRKSHEVLELRVLERTSELKSAYDRLRDLAAHLQTIREEERTKIARDLHDELGQALTAMKLDLSWFRVKYGDHKPISEKTDSMLDRLNSTILSIKRICTELRPSLLDDFGLVAAMEWKANEFQELTGIKCTVIEEPPDIELDKERKIVLYRIFQEALTNVLKHSNATVVEARLMLDDDNQVTLEIADNGKGIKDEQLSKPQSFGLIGMRERVRPWGGRVEIAAAEGRGTSVKVLIPLAQK